MISDEQRKRINETARARYSANHEHRREVARQYYARNRDRIKAHAKRDYEKHGHLRRKRASEPENVARYRDQKRKQRGLPVPTRPCPINCECCGKQNQRALNLDHCHATGAFRGWLCDRCNKGLGFLGDTRESLMRAIAYLDAAAH